jgi:subtilisin family serine protease
MVIVAAAGNDGLNMDLSSTLITPASVPTDNVITVGATRVRPDRPELNDTKPDFSNYGKYRVELGAPGGEDDEENPPYLYGILGLSRYYSDPCNPTVFNFFAPCRRLSGTSFSAPQVVGALALVKSKYPSEDYAGIRDRVIMGVDQVDVLDPNVVDGFRTGGRLNLEATPVPATLLARV